MARYAGGVVMHDSVTVALQKLSRQSSGVSAWWPVSIPGHSSLVTSPRLSALTLKALGLRLASTERSACHHLTAATRAWARRGQMYRQPGPAWPGDIRHQQFPIRPGQASGIWSGLTDSCLSMSQSLRQDGLQIGCGYPTNYLSTNVHCPGIN